MSEDQESQTPRPAATPESTQNQLKGWRYCISKYWKALITLILGLLTIPNELKWIPLTNIIGDAVTWPTMCATSIALALIHFGNFLILTCPFHRKQTPAKLQWYSMVYALMYGVPAVSFFWLIQSQSYSVLPIRHNCLDLIYRYIGSQECSAVNEVSSDLYVVKGSAIIYQLRRALSSEPSTGIYQLSLPMYQLSTLGNDSADIIRSMAKANDSRHFSTFYKHWKGMDEGWLYALTVESLPRIEKKEGAEPTELDKKRLWTLLALLPLIPASQRMDAQTNLKESKPLLDKDSGWCGVIRPLLQVPDICNGKEHNDPRCLGVMELCPTGQSQVQSSSSTNARKKWADWDKMLEQQDLADLNQLYLLSKMNEESLQQKWSYFRWMAAKYHQAARALYRKQEGQETTESLRKIKDFLEYPASGDTYASRLERRHVAIMVLAQYFLARTRASVEQISGDAWSLRARTLGLPYDLDGKVKGGAEWAILLGDTFIPNYQKPTLYAVHRQALALALAMWREQHLKEHELQSLTSANGIETILRKHIEDEPNDIYLKGLLDAYSNPSFYINYYGILPYEMRKLIPEYQ